MNTDIRTTEQVNNDNDDLIQSFVSLMEYADRVELTHLVKHCSHKANLDPDTMDYEKPYYRDLAGLFLKRLKVMS